MLKCFCVFVVYLAVANPAERKAEMYYATVFKKNVFPEASITPWDKNHSVITWNESIDAKNKPLRAIFNIINFDQGVQNSMHLSNLCGTYKNGTYKRQIQLFILKVFANVDACPIKKGTSSVITEPIIYSYTINYFSKCGRISIAMSLQRKPDKRVYNGTISGHFLGYVTGCEADRKAEMFSVNIFQTDKYREVSITPWDDDKKQSTITWNVPVDAETNPLRAEFKIHFFDVDKKEEVSLQNLCGNYKEGTVEHRVKLFILKLFANVNTCPIKKGTSVIVKEPTTYSYSSDNNDKCGLYASSVELYRKNDESNSGPIVVGIFRGEITGCQ